MKKHILAFTLAATMSVGCSQFGLEKPENPTGDFSGEVARIYELADTVVRQIRDAETFELITESQEENFYKMVELTLDSVDLARATYTPENLKVLQDIEKHLQSIKNQFTDVLGDTQE